MLRLATNEVKTGKRPPSLTRTEDIDRDVIGVMLDRDGKPYLKLGQVSTCKRIHVEALKPLRGGGDCGKSISVWENFDGLLVCGKWRISSNS